LKEEGTVMKRRFLYLWISLVVFSLGMPSFSHSGEIKLLFPEFEMEERSSGEVKTYIGSPLKGRGGNPVYSEKGLSEFVKEFENQKYKVDQIELWIQGRTESGGVTKLFISLEGNGGCKVILRPRGN